MTELLQPCLNVRSQLPRDPRTTGLLDDARYRTAERLLPGMFYWREFDRSGCDAYEDGI